jgi:hypothetical protein
MLKRFLTLRKKIEKEDKLKELNSLHLSFKIYFVL